MDNKRKQPKAYKALAKTLNTVEETMIPYQQMCSNTKAILDSAKNGLKAKAAFDFMSVSGFTADEFKQTFNTTVKTLQNYYIKDLKLDAAISEKLLKSFALFKLGIEVFGSAKSFTAWLHVPAYGLGNQIPFELMDTITGISLIEDELSRIAFGDLA
jgi:putative toxin-antitoxin system antitoxin component (TIGR02293 family)